MTTNFSGKVMISWWWHDVPLDFCPRQVEHGTYLHSRSPLTGLHLLFALLKLTNNPFTHGPSTYLMIFWSPFWKVLSPHQLVLGIGSEACRTIELGDLLLLDVSERSRRAYKLHEILCDSDGLKKQAPILQLHWGQQSNLTKMEASLLFQSLLAPKYQALPISLLFLICNTLLLFLSWYILIVRWLLLGTPRCSLQK